MDHKGKHNVKKPSKEKLEKLKKKAELKKKQAKVSELSLDICLLSILR